MKIQSKDNLKMFYYVREGSEERGEGGFGMLQCLEHVKK